jgi:DNA-binding CsgD family transcriptional regulator
VARNLLQYSSAMTVLDDAIVLTKSKPRAEFARLLEGALAWRHEERTSCYVEALRVGAADGVNLGLLIRAVPMSPWYHSLTSPSVIIYVGDPARQQLPPEQFVGRLFGLTPSEALLATLLASGLSLVEAAQKLNLSEGSVRTCSKRIYAKTGVNRQASLVRLILKSVALLAGTDLRRDAEHCAFAKKM